MFWNNSFGGSEYASTSINFNMGCFEIVDKFNEKIIALAINFNMGCFEIKMFAKLTMTPYD